MDIEKLATSAVADSISLTDVLSPFINDGDKEPSWDGNIYIYADKNKNKKGIKKVPVQVKGKTRKRLLFNKPPKYSVSAIDLDNWLNDGGVILFVVFINENGTEKSIYYSSLLPVKIRNIKELNKDKNKISIQLKQFPDDNNQKVSVLLNFYNHRQKQTSFATASLPSLEELEQKGVLESVTLSVTSYGKKEVFDAISAFLTEDVYIYANISGSAVMQPLPEVPIDLHISENVVGDVVVDGKKYYSNYRIVHYSNGYNIVIGRSITLKITHDKEEGLVFKANGFLSDHIRDTECLLAILKAGEVQVNGTAFMFSKQDPQKIIQISSKLHYYNNVKKMLGLMGCNKDLNLDIVNEKDEKNIKNFTNSLIYGRPIMFPGRTDNIIYGRFKIANLELNIWANQETDGYRLSSFFSEHRIALFENSDKENLRPHPISHYALLKQDDFIKADNLDYNVIQEDIGSNEKSPIVADHLTMFMLEMLKAYDEQEQKENQLLDLADQYCDWLTSLSNGDTEEMRLNKLQIIKRRREFVRDEIVELQELRKPEHNICVRCGANLLLGKLEAAQDCFDEIYNDEIKKQFISYPICNFGKLEYLQLED